MLRIILISIVVIIAAIAIALVLYREQKRKKTDERVKAQLNKQAGLSIPMTYQPFDSTESKSNSSKTESDESPSGIIDSK